MDDETTYSIWRFYAPHMKKEKELIESGLTLEEAKEHCNDPATSCADYFDGYESE